MKEYDIAIVGGGLTGLSAGYHLLKKGKEVIIIEKAKDLGGLASSWDLGKYSIEKYYHHISMVDDFFVDFLDELGLKEKLRWKHASIGYYFDNEVYKMDTLLDILRFKGLGLLDAFRLGLMVLKIKLEKDYLDLDNISAKEWIIGNGGQGLYNNFFEPLLRGKFGRNLNRVSAAWLFGRLKFRSKRSIFGERLGYMEHGFKEFIEKMGSDIIKNGGEILTGVEVKKINTKKGSVSTLSTSKGNIKIRNVISTIPPKELIRICRFPNEYEKRLGKIRYQGTLCALFGLRVKLLEGVYWLNIKSDILPFGAIIEHTNFHSIPEYKGDHLVYAVSYIQNEDDPLWKKADEDIIKTFVKGFEVAFPDFKKSTIKWWKLARDIYAAPIYKKGYLSDIGKIKSPIRGLYITGMFMEYPDRFMNEALKLGYEIALKLVEKNQEI